MNIFAFPHAGGDSYCYRNFKSIYKIGQFETLALPGRGKRFGEDCFTSINQMSDEALIQFKLDEPFSFYGHSMGSLIAYLTVLKLKATNAPMPKYLFLSGRRAPSIPSDGIQRHNLPSNQFRKELASLGGCPKEVLDNNELMSLFEPILRSDFQAVETYVHAPIEKIDTKIVLFHGKQDNFSESEIKAWQNETTQPIDFYDFEGGHFFIHYEAQNIIKIISKYLNSI